MVLYEKLTGGLEVHQSDAGYMQKLCNIYQEPSRNDGRARCESGVTSGIDYD